MRWLLVVVGVAGMACGGDGSGEDAPVAGTVVVRTAPGARVDFMSSATDEVLQSSIVDASGLVAADISRGDRAVIVWDQITLQDEVIVIDQLLPEREYAWLPQPPRPTGVSVVVSWPAVAGATSYTVASRCGREVGATTTSAQLVVCPDADSILVSTRGTAVPLMTAYQGVAGSTMDQAVTISAPFVPGRDVAVALAVPSDVTNIDAEVALITPEGVTYQIQPDFFVGATTRAVPLPDLAGTLRASAFTLAPGSVARTVLDQRPREASVALDLVADPLPTLRGLGRWDPATSTITWTLDVDGAASTVLAQFNSNDRRYTFLAPYTSETSVVLPALPADLATTFAGSEVLPGFLAAPGGGYAEAISAFGRRSDPARPRLQVRVSSLFVGS